MDTFILDNKQMTEQVILKKKMVPICCHFAHCMSFFFLLSLTGIAALYTSEFKPYVVFVKPPSIDRLRLSRRNAKVLSSQNEQALTKIFTVRVFVVHYGCPV